MIRFGGELLERKNCVDHLGMKLDQCLTYDEHVTSLGKKVSRLLGTLSNVRHYLPINIKANVYQSLITTHFIYGITIYSRTSNHNLKYLETLMNRVCRNVLQVKPLDIHREDLYRTLKWMNFEQLIKYRTSITTLGRITLGVNHRKASITI